MADYQTNQDWAKGQGWDIGSDAGRTSIWRSLTPEQEKASGGWDNFFNGQGYTSWLRTRRPTLANTAAPAPAAAQTPAFNSPFDWQNGQIVNSGNQYGTSWTQSPDPGQMDPWQEAQRAVQLKYDQKKQAVNDAIAQLQSEQDRAVHRTTDYARQEMADQGLLSSSNAVKKVNDYGNQASAPYLQQIAQQTAGLQNYGNQMGEEGALLYQNLGRGARDEQFKYAQFAELARQFGIEKALQFWDSSAAKELGLAQVMDNYNPNMPETPAFMEYLYNTIHSYPDQTLAIPKSGQGQIGDAIPRRRIEGETAQHVASGQNQQRINLAAEAQKADQTYRDKQLSLTALASGYKYDPVGGGFSKNNDASGISELEFRQLLFDAANQQMADPVTGKPVGYVADMPKLQAIAKMYDRNLYDYKDLLGRSDIATQLDAMRKSIYESENAVSVPSADVVTGGLARRTHAQPTFDWLTGAGSDMSGGPLQQLVKQQRDVTGDTTRGFWGGLGDAWKYLWNGNQ